MKDNYNVIVIGGGIVGLYFAQAMAKKGKSVLVVEKGGNPSGDPIQDPPVLFTSRINRSAHEARNHILGGNSRFWGGALVEDDGSLLAELGADTDKELLKNCIHNVHSSVGVRTTRRYLTKVLPDTSTLTVCEFPVLTGKFRNLWEKITNGSNDIDILINAQIVAISNDKINNTNTAEIQSEKSTFVVGYQNLVITAGIIDSHLIIDRLVRDKSFLNDRKFGFGLHEHLSLHIASFDWAPKSSLSQIFPPFFDKRTTVGRRVEFSINELSGIDSSKAFMHIQAPYDDVEPYKTIKELLFYRQKNYNLLKILKLLIGLLKYLPIMIKIGIERFLRSRLFYPKGAAVQLLVDIESTCDTQSLSMSEAGPVFNWFISEHDIDNLRIAATKALDIYEHLSEESDSQNEYIESAKKRVNSNEFIEYVNTNCKEALHLGGGLQGLMVPATKTGLKCRMPDTSIYVLSTAIFPRAGVANPVHTLLVCAEILAAEIS
jgi:hypothetical protein